MSTITDERGRPYRSASANDDMTRQLGQAVVSVVLILLALLVSFPFLWMVRTSLMTANKALQFPPIWIPQPLSFESYSNALTIQPFARYILNSLFIAAAV